MKKHPIQLEHVGLSQIDFVGYRSGSSEDVVSEGKIEVKFSYSPYEEETKSLQLMGQAKIGVLLGDNASSQEIDENPFYLFVQLHGVFSVDDLNFDTQYANQFASENAPVLMYPFLREHVYSLAIRCGYPNVMIPLIVVPPLRKRDEEEASS